MDYDPCDDDLSSKPNRPRNLYSDGLGRELGAGSDFPPVRRTRPPRLYRLWRVLPDWILEMIVPIRFPYTDEDRDVQLREWRKL